jgi:hypothetical protein
MKYPQHHIYFLLAKESNSNVIAFRKPSRMYKISGIVSHTSVILLSYQLFFKYDLKIVLIHVIKKKLRLFSRRNIQLLASKTRMYTGHKYESTEYGFLQDS